MSLKRFKARQKLLKFKDFFTEITENSETARVRLLQSSESELKILIFFVKLVFSGAISISENCHLLIKKQARFLQLEKLYLTHQLNTLRDRKLLIKFTKVLSLLLETLVL